MARLLAQWLIVTLSFFAVAGVVDGVSINSTHIALVVAVIIGLLNTFIRPFLILITLPLNILTLGLFTLVINGFVFSFVASFVEGFEVSSFSSALVGAFLVSVLSYLGDRLMEEIQKSSHDDTEL